MKRLTLIAAVLLSLAACATTLKDTTMLDLKTVTKSGKPNQYLVAPEGYLVTETADATAPVFNQGTDDLFTALLAVLDETSGTENVRASKESGHIAYVAKVFIFKDDVDVSVLPHPEGSTLAIFSRSRVGYSDMGVNKKRVEQLLADLNAKL
ncbi:DUF1499 domain-containing protein [Parvularcula sp. ZS-1/3]|uniref:DUF1499 domain-containing protein n=1 Tax=Parvularcula mediterranea TaxID=2732508 RepID=A0A7Y3RQ94_9PROT|nr:DUF1499 domain-containing protein [Parvularcula mediterranea]NNU17382.1 DUF1499 domain-containing protein [Parvularcula mediterranea]